MSFNIMKICYNEYCFVIWMISLCWHFTVLIYNIVIYCCYHQVPLWLPVISFAFVFHRNWKLTHIANIVLLWTDHVWMSSHCCGESSFYHGHDLYPRFSCMSWSVWLEELGQHMFHGIRSAVPGCCSTPDAVLPLTTIFWKRKCSLTHWSVCFTAPENLEWEILCAATCWVQTGTGIQLSAIQGLPTGNLFLHLCVLSLTVILPTVWLWQKLGRTSHVIPSQRLLWCTVA